MVKSNAESDLQGGECEDMSYVFGLKCNNESCWVMCKSTSNEESICKLCANVAKRLKVVKVFLENFQNIKGPAVHCFVCDFSFVS